MILGGFFLFFLPQKHKGTKTKAECVVKKEIVSIVILYIS